jgi:hypothetical protein
MISADKLPMCDAPEAAAAVSPDNRPTPFVLRVAAHWGGIADWSGATDGPILVRRRAPLTGCLASTADGGDVQFSDLGV